MKQLLAIATLTLALAHPVFAMENNDEMDISCNQNTKSKADWQKKLDTELINAVTNNNLEMVRLLLEKGASIHAKTSQHGWTPLNMACAKGYVELVKFLLAQKDIKVNEPTKMGKTPLYNATKNRDNQNDNYVQIVKLLLAHKDIDVNKESLEGVTPLHNALYNQIVMVSAETITKELLNHTNIDPTKQIYASKESPLHAACRTSTCKTVLHILNAIIRKHYDRCWWDVKKTIFLSYYTPQDENCHFAKLPMEILHHIFKKNTTNPNDFENEIMHRLKECILSKNSLEQTPGDILFSNPRSEKSWSNLCTLLSKELWSDDETAQKMYHELLELINNTH